MRFRCLAIAALLGLLVCAEAMAHFVWLVVEPRSERVEVQFGESGGDPSPELLDRIHVETVRRVDSGGRTEVLRLERSEEGLTAAVSAGGDDPVATYADVTFGTMTRGDVTFLLKYWAKTLEGERAEWAKIDVSAHQKLDIHPQGAAEGDTYGFVVRWNGAPVAGVEVVALMPGGGRRELTTDVRGRFAVELSESGLYSIRARHVDTTAGEYEGMKYSDARHYSTLTLHIEEDGLQSLPSLPAALTSFGAAVADRALYVYGGHHGRPHRYDIESQSGDLWKLDLDHPTAWESLPGGPRLQGLALVGHAGKVYRMGGFTAMNHEGEDADLRSQDGFAVFDPKKGSWRDLPSMPVARSSFDAAVLDDTIYVVGGWRMGNGEPEWLDSAIAIDLSNDELTWEELPTPPFHRRAMAVAAHDGKIFVCGGMDREGGTTTAVSIYDPVERAWSAGPSLNESGRLAGFGSAAFALGDRLFVTAYDGALQRLSSDGSAWERLEGLDAERFFHRMLPMDSRSLVVLGGASMSTGSYDDVRVLTPPVDPPAIGRETARRDL